MIEIISEMFSYNFLVRAFIVGALVSVCAALLGVSLVLKRYAMIGTGLSNVGFGSLALATALNFAPLTVSIPVVIAAAFLLLRLSENSKIKGDAAIALVSTGSLAVGIIIISQSTGMNTDVCNYLFGSILAMAKSDVYLSITLSVIVLMLFMLFYHKLFAITFDETFARTAGIKAGLYNMLIAFLTALTIVLGMRIMGAMLISSLIIFPALSSMRLFKKFKSVTISSAVISILCFFAGVIISYIYATPTGASVVIVNLVVFVVFWLVDILRNVMNKKVLGIMLFLLFSFVPINAQQRNTVEIRERMFATQVNEIYLNAEDYLGKTIKLEGILKIGGNTEKPIFYVIRYAPDDCCGDRGFVGFEVRWSRGLLAPVPADDSWVEAAGILREFGMGMRKFLYLELTSLVTLDRRGAEFVKR